MACQQDHSNRAMLNRAPVAVATVVVAVFACGLPASAAPQNPIPPLPNSWGYTYGAQQNGNQANGSTGNTSVRTGPAPQPCAGWGGFTTNGSTAICGMTQILAPGAGGPPAITPAPLALAPWQRLPTPVP